MKLTSPPTFVDTWRRRKSAAFDLWVNSTARQVRVIDLWGRNVGVYANANLSIYSGQACNAACPFCVEELRPASRGVELASQKQIEADDVRYLGRLAESLKLLEVLAPTVSITGGEPSKDRRLPQILETVAQFAKRRETLTTNGSGLFDVANGQRVIDHILRAGLQHLNISIAHPVPARNARIMRLPEALSHDQLSAIARSACNAGTRVRLSCVLLQSGVAGLNDVRDYLEFARSIGVDNVIFRQLMKTDSNTHVTNSVVRYSDRERVILEPILDQLSNAGDFSFVRQVMGYYYYVEVWQHGGMDVVFEEADLAQLEAVKQRDQHTIHELVFHPNSLLASTWQPWDGVLGPPN